MGVERLRKLKKVYKSSNKTRSFINSDFYWIGGPLWVYSIILCFFVWGFLHIREFFTYMETSPLPAKNCKFWPMFGTHGHWTWEGSLAWHTYYDMGHTFTMVISEDPWHSKLLLSVWQWSCHYLSSRLRSMAAGIWKTNPAHARRTL